ncbi:MAG: prephenate dehydrogenase/arogenate dehydrogenase family protein, partial [Planctomycetota bacterium]
MTPLDAKIRKVTIVGVGLLGGSIGLSLRASEFDGQIVGVGRRQRSLDMAMEVGTVDVATLDLTEGAAGADLIILATPVGSFERLMTVIKPFVKRTAIVTDVGSTKREVVAAGERVFGRGG